MEKMIFTSYSNNELFELISNAVAEEIKNLNTAKEVDYEWIKIQDAMKILGVSKPTIYSYAKQGLIKLYKVKGRTFILRSEIDKMILND